MGGGKGCEQIAVSSTWILLDWEYTDACVGGDRDEGILVLSGGLTAHNLRDRRSFSPTTASENHKAFDAAMHSAIKIDDVSNWLIVWLRSWTAN